MKQSEKAGKYLQRLVQHCSHHTMASLFALQPLRLILPAEGVAANILHLAVSKDCVKCIRLLLEAEVDVDNADAFGWTPLMLAARHGRSTTAMELVAHGASLNVRGFHGWTALHLAVRHGHHEIANSLSSAGADADVVDNDGIKAHEANTKAAGWGVLTGTQWRPRKCISLR